MKHLYIAAGRNVLLDMATQIQETFIKDGESDLDLDRDFDIQAEYENDRIAIHFSNEDMESRDDLTSPVLVELSND